VNEGQRLFSQKTIQESAKLLLEEALQGHEEKVDSLLKAAGKYLGALKGWKKACQQGHLGNLQKSAAQAVELGGALPEITSETRQDWDFDMRAYLEENFWRDELRETASDKFGLRTLEDGDLLISSPVNVRSMPSRNALMIGRASWPAIRPRIVAAELKRLRDRTVAANSQEFVESLFGACQYLAQKGDQFAKFRDIYEIFCLTPGYKRENPPAAFGQQIYSLHRSDIRTTRSGRKFEIEYPSGNVKERDVFTVISEDGRPIRYYGIWFK
jgi:hypothetical protein